MKYRNAVLLILLIIVVDQLVKIYVKTHFSMQEEVKVAGSWFRIHFLENEGMAFGMKISQSAAGKILLTLFRLIAVVFGFFLLKRLVDRGHSRGLIICGAMILAGAMGNLIDSMFYGLIFTESPYCIPFTTPCDLAHFVAAGKGYAPLLHGKVVDMLYFPIAKIHFPDKIPLLGGKNFEFFEPVFNIADASISTGVLVLIFFQKRLMRHHKTNTVVTTTETT